MTIALIFVPAGEFDPHASRCLAYCERRGYQLAGVVRGDWDAVVRMMCDHAVDAVVVSTSTHLDPLRTPRLEYVSQELRSSGRNQRNQRTRLIRRDAAT